MGGTDVEYVDFWEGYEYGWAVRFRIQSQGAVAGRGLFAARRFASGEKLTMYMGADLGDVGTAEGEGARTRLAAIHRADHVMQIGRRYVDGRDGSSGAQFINTDLHQQGRTNNAKFASTGTVRVTAPGGIEEGVEILMPYGTEYWRQRAEEGRRGRRDERRGGMVAYTQHEKGRLVFVEEVVSAQEVRGHGLGVGRELFGQLMDRVEAHTAEIHLLVETGNAHTRAGCMRRWGLRRRHGTYGKHAVT